MYSVVAVNALLTHFSPRCAKKLSMSLVAFIQRGLGEAVILNCFSDETHGPSSRKVFNIRHLHLILKAPVNRAHICRFPYQRTEN